MQAIGKAVQRTRGVVQLLDDAEIATGCTGGGFARSFQFLQNGALADLVGVQLQGHGPETGGLQPAVNDVERGHLLGDEQHLFTRGDSAGDDIGDGLRLTCSRWPLDDQGAARDHFGDGDGLRAVGVDDVVLRHGRQLVVDMVIVADQRLTFRKAVAQDGGDQVVVGDAGIVGPVFRIKVAIHQKFCE